jgi:hypothetical protein
LASLAFDDREFVIQEVAEVSIRQQLTSVDELTNLRFYRVGLKVYDNTAL